MVPDPEHDPSTTGPVLFVSKPVEDVVVFRSTSDEECPNAKDEGGIKKGDWEAWLRPDPDTAG